MAFNTLQAEDEGGAVSALVAACCRGQRGCARALLDAKAQIDLRAGPHKRTALMHTCAKGQYRCLGILLEAGASMVALDSSGCSAAC